MSWRDDLCMQLMGLRQLVRDLPDHKVPEAAQTIAQLEDYLHKLCGTQKYTKGA